MSSIPNFNGLKQTKKWLSGILNASIYIKFETIQPNCSSIRNIMEGSWVVERERGEVIPQSTVSRRASHTVPTKRYQL